MDSKETKWGFPKGRVASTLRSILSRKFTNQDINAITVVLMLHSMVESAIERVLYLILVSGFPHYSKMKFSKQETNKMKDELSDVIEKMSFGGKLSLIKPYLKVWRSDLVVDINEITRVRNKIAHLEKIKNLKFKNKLIWSEEGIEKFFVASQFTLEEINKFWHWTDECNANIKDRLKDQINVL